MKSYQLRIVGLINLYNFGIKFDTIRDYIKNYEFFLHATICRDGSCYHPPIEMYF
jgi:hypothetical protein